MKSYAVLLAPEFRLQSLLRHSHQMVNDPVALLDVEDTQPRVVEMTNAARASLVECGMTPTQALARCPKLRLIHPNSGHERSAHQAMLQTAETLSPFIELTGTGVVTAELPSQRSWNERDLVEKVVTPLQSLGLDVRVGVGETPDLALLAARYASPVKIVADATIFLAPLSVEALQPSDELASVLESWGIHTIGQFIALPSAQVGERLGPEAIQLLERATGGRSRPLRLIKPQEFFVEEIDLEDPIEMLAPLLFLLRRFLEQITTRLSLAYLAAGKLRLALRFDNGATYQRVFTLPQPTRDVELLFRMLHTHLENFTSETPIIGLELAAKPVRPNVEQFGLLDRSLRDPHKFAETLARFEALLGSDLVGTPELEASHHPDAFRLRPYEPAAPAPQHNTKPLIGVPWLRFRPPVTAKITLNETCPAYLYSLRSTGPIRDVRGPWLLDGDWWESRCWSREEWDISTDDGLFRLVRTEGEWFLDGIYA